MKHQDIAQGYIPSWVLAKTGLSDFWKTYGVSYTQLDKATWKVIVRNGPKRHSGYGMTLVTALQDAYLQFCKHKLKS